MGQIQEVRQALDMFDFDAVTQALA
jgi:hypothetical protein